MLEVESAFARRLVGFACDLTRYAATGTDGDARRAIVSPYSGVAHLDARALCVAAGERHTLLATIAAERVPLGVANAHATHRFARGLETLHAAYRAQGATASEHVASIRIAFELEATLDSSERETFGAIEALAERLDDRRARTDAWEAAVLERELRALAGAIRARTFAAPADAPLPRREAETPRVVGRRRGHFSASSLNTFAECERRWFYRYVCAAVEDRGSSASFYGTAFHWALERFHAEFPRASDAPLELLEQKLDAYLGTAFERYRAGFETNVEYELQRRRAKRTARRYLDWFVERARRAAFTVIGTETAVELDLDGYRFIGYIDRLDRDDATSAVTVVDYKTGTIAESAEEYREKVRRFLDFQLPFYYWARTAVGDRVTRLALLPLKDPSRDVAPIELEVVPLAPPRTYGAATVGTIGLDDLERARAKMSELAAALADGPIERFPVTDDPEVCLYCAYATACRGRPLRCEDRFGH